MRQSLLTIIVLSAACYSQTLSAKGRTMTLPDELVLSGDYVIKAQIEGQPVTLQVRPDTFGFVTLNAEAGTRLGLNFDKVAVGFGYRIGPNMVDAPTKALRINLGAKEEKNRIAWTTRHRATLVADGIISPISLPYKRVTFNLREAIPGSLQLYTLPLDNFGFLGMEGVGTTVKTGKAKMQVKFSLTKKDNLIDATTANWLANWRGGKFVDTPKETEIAFGIKRPVQELWLSEAIAVGPFALDTLFARIADNGDASGIKSESGRSVEVATAIDTSEIVVSGKKQKDENNTIETTLGSDFLKTCTALTYDLEKREIRMMCAPPA